MEPESVLFSFLHLEGDLVVHVHRFQGDRAVDLYEVGAGDGPDAVPGLCHPRHLVPVLEPDDQLTCHLHAAPQPFDPAEDPGMVVARRHEVRDPHRPAGGVPLLLEHQCALHVATTRGRSARLGGEQPPAIGRSAEQGGKASGRVEPGHAQPVDRTIPPDERGGMGVADQGVILDALAHGRDLTEVRRRLRRPGSV